MINKNYVKHFFRKFQQSKVRITYLILILYSVISKAWDFNARKEC